MTDTNPDNIDESGGTRMLEIQRGVYSTQARNARFCLHVGSTAIYFGNRPGYAARLELFTHYHRFRWSWGARDSVTEDRR